MIKFNNSIRTIVTAVILPVIFSSCIREEMTCGNQIVVQRIGEDGGAVTRGTAVSSVSDLDGIVTDWRTPAPFIDQLRDRGVKVVQGNEVLSTREGMFV